MNVNHATEEDFPSWLEIVREVEPLFAPMPDFEVTLLRKTGEKAAFCVRSDCQDDRARVRGGIILGGTPAHGWIRWLAVRSFSRGIGIGQCLVNDAIDRLGGSGRISVDTFREENIERRAARRLYLLLGFLPGPLVEIDGHPSLVTVKATIFRFSLFSRTVSSGLRIVGSIVPFNSFFIFKHLLTQQ